MIDSKDDRSLGELFADLARESSTLLRQEVQLAKTELSQKASALSGDVASMAIGGLVAYAGVLAIIAAVIIGLAAAGLPWWVAALLVGLIVAGIGYGLIQRGLTALKREDLTPRRTIESLQEDAQWAKEQVR
jgi:UDP-N-acetylmuramyl pentapeptide phosphotransferase/UDP-N-acetylglucosamine-1-phosphate transferase